MATLSNSDKVTQFRRNRKQNLVNIHGGKCSLCGYNRCIDALEFHHIKPEEKEYALSSPNCHSFEKDVAESRKCLLVCSNCHSEIHHSDFYENKDLFEFQHIDEQLILELTPKSHQKYYCSECGAEITIYSRSGLCKSCVSKGQRKIERPTREELKDMIRTTSFTQIGKQYGITDNGVRKWCKTMNLPHTQRDINKISDEDWVKI